MNLQDYRDAVSLTEPLVRPEPYAYESEKVSALNRVFGFLLDEYDESFSLPETPEEKSRLLRGLLNQRAPGELPRNITDDLDRILWTERTERGIVETGTVPDVWRGDITQLKADAIVNAANSDMLGCFRPLHACIDNAIHSAAGPQLREDCHTIMQLQGAKEETGTAKITRAWNLPSKYVLHTVGPIVNGPLTEAHTELLASCYTSCLDLAAQVDEIKSIAFCCLSTGVFGYPKEEAAITAIETVEQWKQSNPGRFDRIIFNVFTEEDHDIYKRHIQTR